MGQGLMAAVMEATCGGHDDLGESRGRWDGHVRRQVPGLRDQIVGDLPGPVRALDFISEPMGNHRRGFSHGSTRCDLHSISIP